MGKSGARVIRDWRPFCLTASSREEYLHLICQEPLEYPVGTKVVYSDLGFKELVMQPLNLQETGYLPYLDYTPARIAATEVGNQFEYAMCQDFVVSWRKELHAAAFLD